MAILCVAKRPAVKHFVMAEGFGICTWPYAVVDGVRTHISEAARLQHGICPVCGAELVARKGKFREDHWWHVNGKRCDPWYQPKGPWHLYWQNMFPKECQEVVVEGDVDGTRVRHIADVKTFGGIVLEVQYSAISPETIAIREAFYCGMLWLANMTRVWSDNNVLEAMKRNGPYAVGEEMAWVVNETRLIARQKWFLATKPVAFDFSGALERPQSDEHLYCLLPNVGDGQERVCFEVDRYRLIDALRAGSCGRLFRLWKESVATVLDLYKADLQARREKAEAEERARHEEARKQQREMIRRMDEERRLRRIKLSEDAEFYRGLKLTEEEIETFITGRFDATLGAALSLGWVETYLICCHLITYDAGIPAAGFDMPKMGRMVLHYVNGYTYEEFKNDAVKAKECFGYDVAKTLDYEKMRKLRGKVVAAADYCICNDGSESGVAIRNLRMFNRRFDLFPNKVGFSKISEKQSSLFSAYDRAFDCW